MSDRAPPLDQVFHALAHPARRAVLRRLSVGPATVSELAEAFDMALPSFLQHLDRLSGSGLVTSRKKGRVRTYRLTPGPLAEAESWMAEQRGVWEQRMDQLDSYLLTLRDSEESS
ncbi:MAG: ArsR family transcriptional regulator [Gemmatimonadales bacterium]|nr:MAG: ArsR family transcriptional regulator [Gemmatimonadales bacterium]